MINPRPEDAVAKFFFFFPLSYRKRVNFKWPQNRLSPASLMSLLIPVSIIFPIY
jgi:hypothetical protein